MPATIATYITSPFVFIALWISGGLIAFLGATIYAELGVRFPMTGGPFVLVQRSMGSTVGFFCGWSDWIANMGSTAYLAIGTMEYINKLFNTNIPLGITSSALIIIIGFIHWRGTKESSIIQKVMSSLKALGLLFFITACFVYFFQGHEAMQEQPSTNSVPFIPAIILSLRAIVLTYFGWNNAVYFSEEDKNPEKNLSRSLFFGIAIIMLIYVLINLGLIVILPLDKIADSILPAADAAGKIFGSNGATIVTILAIVFLLGILNAGLLITPRILFAISRAGLFFKSISFLNKHAIPGNALIITIFAAVLLSLTGIFNLVVNVTVLFAILVDLFVYISIIFVRRKTSTENSTHQSKLYPWNAIIMILITLGLVVGLFFEDTINCIYSLIILAVAFILYFLFKKMTKKNRTF